MRVTAPQPADRLKTKFTALGPGIVIAATGVGAGDLIAAAVGGARFGTTILWAALIGALLKGVLNEGLARRQLVTGTTLLDDWFQHLPRAFSLAFGVYLVLWSFMVAAALIAACGLAGHALFPDLSVAASGIIHAIVALVLVWFGRYALFEKIMGITIALMFLLILACAVVSAPPISQIAAGLFSFTLPGDGISFVLGVIGGVGGSVTVMCYGYWMREKGWRGTDRIPTMRLDLTVAYALTGLFAVAVMLVAAGAGAEAVQGSGMVLGLADQLGETLGGWARLVFLIGFEGAVFSSMLGVWHGVPFLFSDFLHRLKQKPQPEHPSRGVAYRGFLLFMAIPPMAMLYFQRPVLVVIVYAIAGALFMPFLAFSLLLLNNRRREMQVYSNSVWINLLLVAALLLFAVLTWFEIQGRLL